MSTNFIINNIIVLVNTISVIIIIITLLLRNTFYHFIFCYHKNDARCELPMIGRIIFKHFKSFKKKLKYKKEINNHKVARKCPRITGI